MHNLSQKRLAKDDYLYLKTKTLLTEENIFSLFSLLLETDAKHLCQGTCIGVCVCVFVCALTVYAQQKAVTDQTKRGT